MKKILAVLATLLLATSVYADGLSPIGTGGSGGGIPGGSNGQAQYNNNGVFGGLTNGSCITTSGATINTTNFISQTISGSTATITGADSCGTVYITTSGNVAISSASAASTGLTSGFAVTVENHGTGTATWTPTGSTINGSASLAIGTNTGCSIWSDGTNFQLFRSACTALPISSGNLPANVTLRTIGITIDGAGTTPGTGIKGYFRIPFGGTITGWSLISDISGSAVVDVWKVAGGSPGALTLPTITNTITASALPTLSSAQSNYSTTLTGWTTSVSAGDVFGYNLNSATTLTRATLELYITTN